MTAPYEHRNNNNYQFDGDDWDEGMATKHVTWKVGTTVSATSTRTALTTSLPTTSLSREHRSEAHNRPNSNKGVVEGDDESISVLSMGSATLPPAQPTTKTKDHPIPALICFIEKRPLLSEPPHDTTSMSDTSTSVLELQNQRHTRGMAIVHPYAIGDIVGQSIPLHHMMKMTTTRDAAATTTAAAAADNVENNDMPRPFHKHRRHMTSKILYTLRVTCWRPLQQLFQRRPCRQASTHPGILLRPSPSGHLV